MLADARGLVIVEDASNALGSICETGGGTPAQVGRAEHGGHAAPRARLSGNAGFPTELVHHERPFPNPGVAPNAPVALERLPTFVPRGAFIRHSRVGRRSP